MSNVTGCSVGYKAEMYKCKTCPRAPYLSQECMEYTHHEVNGIWYPKPFLSLFSDAPIPQVVWANKTNTEGE